VNYFISSEVLRQWETDKFSGRNLKIIIQQTVLTSHFFTKEVDSKLPGIAYKGLNLNLLSNFRVPLPPLAEQQIIVDRVDKLMSMISELEKQLADRKKLSEKLMQAVLKEVFAEE
jgi:restriction endonuclease S subunit